MRPVLLAAPHTDEHTMWIFVGNSAFASIAMSSRLCSSEGCAEFRHTSPGSRVGCANVLTNLRVLGDDAHIPPQLALCNSCSLSLLLGPWGTVFKIAMVHEAALARTSTSDSLP